VSNRTLSSSVRRPWLRAVWATLAVLVGVLLVACESPRSSARPSASLVELEFTARPSLAASGSSSAQPSAWPSVGAWPVGWDVAFCTAMTDATVAHELVIDIERALNDDAREDAAALVAELAEIAPIASNEITRLRDWEPAAAVKADMITLIALDMEVATAYQQWLTEGGRSLLRDARQARKAVGRAIPPANENLQALADLGLSCPGVRLELETL
jgi:hypothetical protein